MSAAAFPGGHLNRRKKENGGIEQEPLAKGRGREESTRVSVKWSMRAIGLSAQLFLASKPQSPNYGVSSVFFWLVVKVRGTVW